MAKYAYQVIPAHLLNGAKHYTLGKNNKLLALHLKEGKETKQVEHYEDGPPIEKVSFAPDQGDLQYLFEQNHPFVERIDIQEVAAQKADKTEK